MTTITSKTKSHLKSLAHHLKPLTYVGKTGVTERLIVQISQTLLDHELVRVKFNDFKDKRKELCIEIETNTESSFIGLTGNTAIFYKPHPLPEKRKIVLPEHLASVQL